MRHMLAVVVSRTKMHVRCLACCAARCAYPCAPRCDSSVSRVALVSAPSLLNLNLLEVRQPLTAVARVPEAKQSSMLSKLLAAAGRPTACRRAAAAEPAVTGRPATPNLAQRSELQCWCAARHLR